MTLGEYAEMLRQVLHLNKEAVVPAVFLLVCIWVFWRGISRAVTEGSNSTLAIGMVVSVYIFFYCFGERMYTLAIAVVPYFISFGREAYIRLIRGY